MKIKLSPCPFCGGKAEPRVGLNNFVDVEIQCVDCCASGGCFDQSLISKDSDDLEANKVAAAKHWNTRYNVREQLV